jgi:16S rRNA processing protein RimM
MSKKILLGKIITAFGIKGDVKIESYCEVAQEIENYPLFDEKGEKISLKINNKNKTIVGYSANGAILIAKVNDIMNRTDAEKLRGKELFSNRDNFKKTKKNEFYYSDLIGLQVVNKESKKVGTVSAINNYGGGVMVEIKFDSDDLKKYYDEIDNFPFKNEIFPEVNLEEKFVLIDYQK